MEKRNYVKPAIELYGINSTTSFMAASDIVIEGGTEDNNAALLLDQCFMISGYLVSNQSVINQLGSDYTKCFYSKPYEQDKPNEIVCSDPRFANLRVGTGVKVTYDPINETFTFSFEGCGNQYWH